jgi:hypothetical protein
LSIPTRHGDTYSIDFLAAIAQAALDYVKDQESALLQNMICLRNKRAPNCAQIRKTLLETVPRCAASARANLYLAYEKQMDNFDFDSLGPNFKMEKLGVSKAVPWAPPAGEELQILKDRFNKLFKTVDTFARQERQKFPSVSVDQIRKENLSFYRGMGDRDEDLIGAQRGVCGGITSTESGTSGFLRNYKDIMQTWPILSYIKSKNPDASEIMGALRQLQDNTQKQRLKLQRMLDEIDRNPTSDVVSSDLLELLGDEYFPLILQRLEKNPEFCGIAASLAEAKQSREEFQAKAGLAAGLPLMFAPPAWAFAGGILLTGGYMYSDRATLTDLRQKAGLNVQTIPNKSDMIRVSQSVLSDEEFNNNVGIVLSPLALFGGTSAVQKLKQLRLLKPRMQIRPNT